MKEVEIDDVMIYRGDIFKNEKDRNQIVTDIDVNGSFFTKFLDTGDLNIINPHSGYFELCEIIPKEEHKLSLENGIPINWDDEN